MSSIADRLSAARQRHFVGRAAERALFRSALTAADFPFLLLYVFGPVFISCSGWARRASWRREAARG